MTDSIWEYPDGTWTLASHVVRSLAYAVPAELSAAELHFIAISLDATRFRWLCDHSDMSDQEAAAGEGNTVRARTLCDRISKTAELLENAISSLDRYIQSGDREALDEFQLKAAPFGIQHADELVLQRAIHSRDQPLGVAAWNERLRGYVQAATRSSDNLLGTKLDRRLALVRRFGYPTYKFLDEFIVILRELDVPIEAPDVVAGILAIPTYEVGFYFDKGEVYRNRSWYETMVIGCAEAFDRTQWSNEDTVVAMLIRTYNSVQDRLAIVKGDSRWMQEARLGAALQLLFGDDEVQIRARPKWLNRQHLDFFLPRFSLAVEYMGIQHFEAFDWLGGKESLESIHSRDQQKRRLCAENGVTLIYVNHDEDVGRRAREIRAACDQ